MRPKQTSATKANIQHSYQATFELVLVASPLAVVARRRIRGRRRRALEVYVNIQTRNESDGGAVAWLLVGRQIGRSIARRGLNIIIIIQLGSS